MYPISVIIPIYKVEQYIEKCARSLFEQTLSSIEFIFVDDCSPDHSVDILRSVLNNYPNRILHTKIIRHNNNRGLAAARNTGRIVAQGEYVISCDSDDWVEPNMYESMYKKARQTNADIVICDWMQVYQNSSKRIYVNPPANNMDCIAALLSGRMHGSVCNKLIKRELYTKYNIVNIEGVNYCEDLFVTYKLFYYAHSIAYINQPFYNYRQINSNSYTSSKLSQSSQSGLIFLANDVKEFISRNHIDDKAINDSYEYLKISIIANLLLHGDISNATQIDKVKMQDVLLHPSLPFHYKIVVLLLKCNCKKYIKVVCYLYNFLKKIRLYFV